MDHERLANYSFGEKIICLIALIYTKLCWKQARLIRLPCFIRGKKAISYGSGFTTGYNCRIECNGIITKKRLIIGVNCIIGDYAHIVANNEVVIGDNVLIASRVFITDSNHGIYKGHVQSDPAIAPNQRMMHNNAVKIGNNVWIGENVSILPGVNIEDGCIIGANSVVTQKISRNSIAVGIPAKIIKKYDKTDKCWQSC